MKVLILVVTLVVVAECDYNFNLKLEYYKHEKAMSNEKFKFKFCMYSRENDKCESTMVTQTLGQKLITEDQFRQTTQFLSFKIPNDQIESRDYLFNLSIAVLNSNDKMVSNWNLFIAKESSLLILDQWIRYNQIKSDLSQQLTFSYNLKCFDGFKGFQCSIPVCDLNCHNNGKCVRENGKQFCRCDPSLFKGDLCEIKVVNTCDRCLNGGSCFGTNECLCPPGYGGKGCEIKQTESECGLFSCQNSGRCFIDNQNEYSCLCPQGFSGKRCQIKLTSRSIVQETKISTTQSTARATKISSAQSNTLNGHEMVIILIAGVGIPILFVLVAVIFYKIVVVEKKKELKDVESGTKQFSEPEIVKERKENIYIVCQSNSGLKSDFRKSSTTDSTEIEVYSNCIYEDLNQYEKNGTKDIHSFTKQTNNYSENLTTYV